MLGLKRHRLSLLVSLVVIGTSSFAQEAECEFQVTNEWNSGFTSSVKITNNTSEIIEGWQVDFVYPDSSTISNVWNADLNGSNPYQLRNKHYNSNILPDGTVSFGFNSQKGSPGQTAPLPVLSGICDSDDSVSLAPTAEFTTSVSSGDIPLVVTFDASASSSGESEISQYSWDFGDGTTASGLLANHTFDQTGEFNVQLIVTDDNGETSIANTVIVATAPQPDDAQCEFIVQNEWHSGFTGKVRVTNDASYSIEGWDVLLSFPDATYITGFWNSQLSGNNPYDISNANYNASIQPGQSVEFGFNAQKAQAGSDVSQPTLSGICRGGSTTVNSAPTAIISASSNSGPAPLTVNFDGEDSNDDDGDQLSYLWNFTDTEQSEAVSPSFTFTQPGTYTVILTVSDGELSSEPVSITITVEETIVTEPLSWQLDQEKSSLWFVSSKKLHTLENHTFDTLSGSITPEGDASLVIDLDSVETFVDIRNDRMREYLFETGSFPSSEVLLSIEPAELQALQAGQSQVSEYSALLNLHGISLPISTVLRVSKLPSGSILVNNLQPVVLSTPDFNLDTGIEVLKTLAGLDSIGFSVPVNFHLMFNPVVETE